MLKIPFDASRSADQNFRVLIPERMVISLRLVWNTRASAWFITISSERGEIGAFRIVERWPILFSHKAISPIDGDIIALPLSDGKGKPLNQYDALGESWGLFWLSPEDVANWKVANGLG